jgi:hypothetical protein
MRIFGWNNVVRFLDGKISFVNEIVEAVCDFC